MDNGIFIFFTILIVTLIMVGILYSTQPSDKPEEESKGEIDNSPLIASSSNTALQGYLDKLSSTSMSRFVRSTDKHECFHAYCCDHYELKEKSYIESARFNKSLLRILNVDTSEEVREILGDNEVSVTINKSGKSIRTNRWFINEPESCYKYAQETINDAEESHKKQKAYEQTDKYAEEEHRRKRQRQIQRQNRMRRR